MKKYLSLVLSLLLISSSSVPAYAVTYPVGTPTGEEVGGWFNTYFSNIFDPIGCNPGQVIRGFTNTGMLLCITPTVVPCLPGGTGLGNTCYGSGSLQNNTIGYQNAANGDQSLTSNTTGYSNVANGYHSLYSNTSGNNNTAIGTEPLYSNVSGHQNTANGYQSLYSNINGSNNVAFGYFAGRNLISGDNNMAFGSNTDFANPIGSNQLNIGNLLFGSNLNGTVAVPAGNIGIGTAAPTARLHVAGQIRIVDGSEGSGKILVSDAGGLSSWSTIAPGVTATGIIGGSGDQNYIAKFGTGGIGIYISQLFDNGSNVGIGTIAPGAKLEVAGQVKITGGVPGVGKVLTSDAVGLAIWSPLSAGYPCVPGGSMPTNTCYGTGSLASILNGDKNAGYGAFSLSTLQNGEENTGIGHEALYTNRNGNRNTAIGYRANYTLTNPANDNTSVGNRAGYNITSGSNNIAIGSNTDLANATTSNQLNIGNAIFGTSLNGTVSAPAGNIGIGTTTPGAKLEVAGQIKITGGTPGIGKVLSSDATGLATWTNPAAVAGAWMITGNSGTVAGTNFLGTTDPIDLVFRTNNTEKVRILSSGNMGVGTPSPGAKLEIAGQIKITGGAPGLGKTLVSDATGLASWISTVSGSTATGIIGGSGDQNYIAKFGTGGVGIYISQLFDNGTNIGIGTSIPNYHLDFVGTEATARIQANISRSIQSSSYGIPYMRFGGATSAVGNLQTIGFGRVANSTSYSPAEIGFITTSSSSNTRGDIVFANRSSTSNVVPTEVMRIASNGNVGIGTSSATARLTLDSGTNGTAGLRFSQVSSTTTPYAGASLGLGVDAGGNIVPISNGDVVVYEAQGRSGPQPVPDPDIPNREISYNFNNYFAIPTKQSFVVSDGNGAGYNAPYFKEDGVSGLCSGGGSPYDCAVADPVVGMSASPNNSFTMTAKGPTYGYQIALGARGDAPLFARSGKFVGSQTGGLFLSDNVTPTPWQKVLTVPANHLEYFYVNIGYNSQLQSISGGGNVGIGTSFPDRRLVIASSGTTTADDPIVQIRRGFQGSDSNLKNTYGTPYLHIGGLENRVGALQTIGFGYNSLSGTTRYAPAEIGFLTTSTTGNTRGDIVFANRNGTTNVAPTEVMRITSNGRVGLGSTTPQTKFEIDSGVSDTSGLRFTRLNNTSPLTSSGVITIGVNSFGDVVGISPVSTIAVYEGVNRSTVLTPDPDTANLLINYNYNNYFSIPGKQSFVVSNGATVSNNGPFIKENGVVGMCSWSGTNGSSPYNCIDQVDGLSASPQNSFTMTAKSDNVGYQMTLSARGDAPLLARSGYFTDPTNQTGGLYLADLTTISPWQKVLSIPVNHPEYFYVNNGFNSQLQVISGGGNVGIGTTYPGSRFEIWTGASTAPLMHFRGTNNVAIGLDALDTSATGTVTSSNNSVIGYRAGQNLTTGSNNIMLGADTRAQSNNSTNTMNIGNTLFATSLPSSFGGLSGNIGIGVVAPTQQLDIARSINLASTDGASAGVIYKNGTRFIHNYSRSNDNNVFIGLDSGNFTMGTGSVFDPTFYGTENVAVGAGTLSSNTTGYSNTALGHNALTSNTSGNNNMAVGWGALNLNTSGYANTAIGRGTLGVNTSGYSNTAIGMSAMQLNTTGYFNTAIGYESLKFNTTAGWNTALGHQSLLNNTTGWYNTAIGYQSLGGSTSTQNTAVGYRALYSSSNGFNTAIGLLAGSNITSGSYNIAIGYNAQVANNTLSNQLSIGNWIYGTAGDIGIGTNTPTAKLDINGTIRIRGGNPGLGKILMSDSDGIGSWQTPSGGAVIPWTVAGNSGTIATSNFMGTTDAQDLAFRTNNVERMRLDSNGNFGVGTASPGSYKLNINGTSYFANTVDIQASRFINFLNPGVGNAPGGFNFGLSSDSASLYAIENTSDNSDYVFKMGDNAESAGDRYMFWQTSYLGIANDRWPLIMNGQYAAFDPRFSGNMSTGAMLDSTVYMNYNTRNVGIGTNSPDGASRLDVNGIVRIRGGSPGNGKVLVSDATGLASWQALSGSSGALGNWSIVGNTGMVATTNFVGTIDAIDLLLKTNNTERLRLNAGDGNITIGGDMMLGRGRGYIFGNTTFGAQALNVNSSGYQNTAIGFRSLNLNTSGYSNTALGYAAGSGITIGNFNTVLGYRAGANITTGTNNIALGNDAQVASATLSNQLSIGNWIYGNGGNIGIGTNNPGTRLEVAGQVKITGGTPGLGKVLTSDAVGLATWEPVPASITEWSKTGNSILGTDFLGTTNAQDLVFRTNNIERARILQTGNISINGMILGRGGNGTQVSTTALGVSALLSNTTGVSNTAMGNSALASIVSGGYNTAIGHGALFASTSNNNTAIGYNAGNALTTGSNNIAIGYNAQVASSTSSNQLSIGNWIYGSGGNIGIGINNPGSKLTVSGSLQIIDGNQAAGKYLKSDANGVASWQVAVAGTGTFIYRMSASITSTNNVLLPIATLTSEPLPIGPYQFELIGNFQSASVSNGIGITLAENGATLSELIATVRMPLTTSTMYESSFSTPGVPVISTDVPAVSTNYPLLMAGTFNVTNTGAVVIQYRSELGGTQVRLQPGTVLIIRSLNPSLYSGGI